MNGVREEYSIKVKQTSKGIWYCDGLQVIADKFEPLIKDLNDLMVLTEGVLTVHNKVEEPNEWEKAAKKAKNEWAKAVPKPVDVGGGK